MRTLLQDLAQKSLKGLGTKACTNWEDRSANSLAYQVSNHSIFLYAVWLRLQSSHLMRATLHDFKGHSYASELKGWCFCIVSEHTGQGMFHLNENLYQQTLTSYFHLCVWWRGAQKMSHCHVRALLALSRVFFLSFFFVLLLQCDKLPSPHFLQAPMRGWIYLLLFDISQMECNTAQKQYLTLCLGAETIGISDQSGRLISLLHALTVWQFWKGQLWNSNALQSYFIFDYIMLVIPQAILQQSKVFDDTEVAVATKKTSLSCKWSHYGDFFGGAHHVWAYLIFALVLVWFWVYFLLLPNQVFYLLFEYFSCTQSEIHLRKWADTKLQQHTHALCSTFNLYILLTLN